MDPDLTVHHCQKGHHLNNAGNGIMTPEAHSSFQEALKINADGSPAKLFELFDQMERAHQFMADYLGCEATDLSQMPNCALGLSAIAFGFPLEKSHNIVSLQQEYPSNLYPWRDACNRAGAELRLLQTPSNYETNTQALIDLMDRNTKIMAVSWVQFQTGSTLDLKRLSEACSDNDTYLIVDGSQGLGQRPFHFDNAKIDAFASVTFKWQCGPFGHGLLITSERLRNVLSPPFAGAMTYGTYNDYYNANQKRPKTSQTFASGSPPLFQTIASAQSMKRWESIGWKKITKELNTKTKYVLESLRKLNVKIISKHDSKEINSIITFTTSKPPEEISEQLYNFEISHSARAGGIRLSPHFYTPDDSIDFVVEKLKKII